MLSRRRIKQRLSLSHQLGRCFAFRHDRLQESGSAIAGREFGRGYFYPALHPRRMFDKIDLDGGSREQTARQDSDELDYLTHCSTRAGFMA